jgi:hypothetical protein
MTTAIVGVGNVGTALAYHLVHGGEAVVLAAENESNAQALAEDLGPLARAASVGNALDEADVVIFAVWLDTIEELIAKYASALDGKVVIDPSNPIGVSESGEMIRTVPDGQSAGSLVAALLPRSAHYAKAFGTLDVVELAKSSKREQMAVLFYATDDDTAAAEVERLIRTAGFGPLKVGGVGSAGRIEFPGGDLHQNGGLNGRVLDHAEAQAAIAT